MTGSTHAVKNETDYWIYQSMREQTNGHSTHPMPVGYQMVNQQVHANPDYSQSHGQSQDSSSSILETVLRNGRKPADQGYVHSAENPTIPTNAENVPPSCCQYPLCSPTATNGASPTVEYPSNIQEQIQQPPGPHNRYLVNYQGYPIAVNTSNSCCMVPSMMIPSLLDDYEVQQRYDKYTNANNNEKSSPNRTNEQASTDEQTQKYVTYPWMKFSINGKGEFS